jgi:hypothetical protein
LGTIFTLYANLSPNYTGTRGGNSNLIASGVDIGTLFVQNNTIYPAVSFTPLSITGIQLWLDAKDITTITKDVSNLVSQWNDKSGASGRYAVNYGSAGTNVLYNATGFNSLPAIQFSSGQSLRCSVPSGTFTTAGITVFIIFKKTGSANTYETIITRTNNANPDPFDFYNGSRIFNGANSTLPTVSGMNLSTATSNNLFGFTAIPGNYTEYLNGTLAYNQTVTNGYFTDDANSLYMYIGTRGDKFTKFTGVVSEVIAYNNVLSISDRQKIEGYLAWKWGLQSSLPSGHPYKSVAP